MVLRLLWLRDNDPEQWRLIGTEFSRFDAFMSVSCFQEKEKKGGNDNKKG
jgi:hypothetical protein